VDEVSIETKFSINSELSDDQAMSFALEMAEKGLGWVSPNPAVGCVILNKNNRLIGYGYHEKFGGPHAEINALRGLTLEQLQGARVFVTLEPCSHYGKTPPCAEALAKLPIQEVIYGLQDPNPKVQGKGLDLIQRAGIKVKAYSKLHNELEKVCEHFLKNMREQGVFVTLKAAVSLDGKLALKNGQSQWITGEESRIEAHRLRAFHDTILIGVNTFLSDNPSLNIRHPNFNTKTNYVVVLDPTGRGIKHIKLSKLYSVHKPENIIWVVSSEIKATTTPLNNINKNSLDSTNQNSTFELNKLQILSELGVKIIFINKFKSSISNTDNFLNLNELLQKLWELSIRSVLVEGGAATMSSFINQKCADRVSLFVAPMIVGDLSGLSWASQINPIEQLSQSVSLGPMDISKRGQDLFLSARMIN